MESTRRDLSVALAASALLSFTRTAAAESNPPPGHDMTMMPPEWTKAEKIAFVIYPRFTALDMVGPHYMLTNLMGATIHIVAQKKEPVTSDSGLVFLPSASFDDCPDELDILCVPGGSSGTVAAMEDDAMLRFLRDRGARAKFVTSVCTGSLLLGAAGLLDGYRATSHWVAKSLLPVFGAIPAEGRVVVDRNRITAAGVTAGMDFGLGLVGRLRDRTYAEAVQLLAEYAPQPPYEAGTPERAPKAVRDMIEAMFPEFLATVQAEGSLAFKKAKSL